MGIEMAYQRVCPCTSIRRIVRYSQRLKSNPNQIQHCSARLRRTNLRQAKTCPATEEATKKLQSAKWLNEFEWNDANMQMVFEINTANNTEKALS